MFAASFILLTCFANRISGFTLAELQQGVPGDLATQTVLSLSSDEPSGSNVRLSGGIPPEIGQLTNLTVLRLSKFQLTGPLPPEIGNLTRLVTIDLSWNNLTGPLPFSLNKLTALGSLTSLDDPLGGSAPGGMSDIPTSIHENKLAAGMSVLLGGHVRSHVLHDARTRSTARARHVLVRMSDCEFSDLPVLLWASASWIYAK
jgi:hypothetical protein